jgi:hypothetical protein
MGGMSEAKIAEGRLPFQIDVTLFVAFWLEPDNPFCGFAVDGCCVIELGNLPAMPQCRCLMSAM